MIDQLTSWLLMQPPDVTARLVPPGVAALTRVFPVLQRLPQARRPLLPGSAPLDTEVLRRQGMAALLELVRRIGAEQPIVSLTDDAQWSTDEAIEMMSLFDGPGAPTMLNVFTHDSTLPNTRALRRFARWKGDARCIDLGGPVGDGGGAGDGGRAGDTGSAGA
jgi:hypothetical protein